MVKLYCGAGQNCPTAYLDDNGDFIIQGYKLGEGELEGLSVPDLGVVRVPRELITKTIQALDQRTDEQNESK